MAHELDINNGVASFAARTDAWHRLGQIVGHAMTAEEASAAAHLSGWDVRKMPLMVPQEPVITDNGVTTPAPLPVDDHFATVRTNPITGNIDVLGVVGSKYEPVQNEESCALLHALTRLVCRRGAARNRERADALPRPASVDGRSTSGRAVAVAHYPRD
jgi:hypothetical protein